MFIASHATPNGYRVSEYFVQIAPFSNCNLCSVNPKEANDSLFANFDGKRSEWNRSRNKCEELIAATNSIFECKQWFLSTEIDMWLEFDSPKLYMQSEKATKPRNRVEGDEFNLVWCVFRVVHFIDRYSFESWLHNGRIRLWLIYLNQSEWVEPAMQSGQSSLHTSSFEVKMWTPPLPPKYNCLVLMTEESKQKQQSGGVYS